MTPCHGGHTECGMASADDRQGRLAMGGQSADRRITSAMGRLRTRAWQQRGPAELDEIRVTQTPTIGLGSAFVRCVDVWPSQRVAQHQQARADVVPFFA